MLVRNLDAGRKEGLRLLMMALVQSCSRLMNTGCVCPHPERLSRSRLVIRLKCDVRRNNAL